MTEVERYVEFPNETGIRYLGIGRIAGTNDLYVTRFALIVGLAEVTATREAAAEGTSQRYTFKTLTFVGGQRHVSDNESVPIVTRYIEMLKTQYEKYLLVRCALHPFVEDFKCITG